jgi:NTE family protein
MSFEQATRGEAALALSGGGYRAMLFHLGAVTRLNELGLLHRMDRISSVSGGSLLAGRLAVCWKDLVFADGVATNFEQLITRPVLRFSTWLVDYPAIVLGVLPGMSAATVAAWLYRRGLVGAATLQDLPGPARPGAGGASPRPAAPGPRFVFNATHLATASLWRFSKSYMGNYRIGLVDWPDERVATAVAASAAFPPFLSPLTLRLDPDRFRRVPGADLFDRRDFRTVVPLCDGGLYDNMGLETVDGPRFRELYVSDAGGGLTVQAGPFRLWTTQVRRIIDTSTEQGRALRRRMLIPALRAGDQPGPLAPGAKRGAYWRTSADVNDPGRFPAGSAFPVHPGWPAYLAGLPTQLHAFPRADRFRLVNWGYLVADAAIRSWALKDAPAPTALPFRRFGFTGPPTHEVDLAGDVGRDEEA